MPFELPPVVKLAERMLTEIEEAVRRFPRFHKYSHGAQLRQQAMMTAQIAHRAWRDRAKQDEWIRKLVWQVDDLKLSLQLGARIKAFSSFGQFEALARTASELGRQVGGWHRQRQLHLKGQNPAHGVAPERAQILSAHTASAEAKR
jgi:hypothetical protein